MQICLFLLWQPATGAAGDPALDAQITQSIVETVRDWRGTVDSLNRVIVHTPTEASDRYLNDRNGPELTLQCYFSNLFALESALSEHSAVSRLLASASFRPIMDTDALQLHQQAMIVRHFAVDSTATPDAGQTFCTYQVAYESSAAEVDAWLADYLTHHVPLLKAQPGIVEVEVYTRLDWISSLPYPRARAVQRNKAVFPDPRALTAALHSSARDALRAHSLNAPPFDGSNTHFPMASTIV